MKRHLALSLILLLSVALYAQKFTPKHEFFVGYGFAPLATSISDPELPVNSIVGAPYSTNNKRFTGTINAGYLFHVSDPLAIGISYSYGTVKRDVVLGSSIPLAEIKNSCHTVMLTGKYAWLRLERFTFYSRVGFGLMLLKKGEMNILFSGDPFLSSGPVDSDRCMVWQAMPIGVEWNFAKHLALFAEGGVGTTGCAIAGVKVLF